MKNLSDDASLPEQIPQLKQEIATIEQALKELDAQTRAAMASENPAQGIFCAAKIHELRQQKLVLQTRRELRAVKIRRINYLSQE